MYQSTISYIEIAYNLNVLQIYTKFKISLRYIFKYHPPSCIPQVLQICQSTYTVVQVYKSLLPSSRIQPQPWFKLYSPGWLVFFGGRLVGAPPQVPPPPWMDSQQRLPWAGFCLHEPACTCQNGPSHLKLSFSDEPRCTISSKQPRRRTSTISDQ